MIILNKLEKSKLSKKMGQIISKLSQKNQRSEVKKLIKEVLFYSKIQRFRKLQIALSLHNLGQKKLRKLIPKQKSF